MSVLLISLPVVILLWTDCNGGESPRFFFVRTNALPSQLAGPLP